MAQSRGRTGWAPALALGLLLTGCTAADTIAIPRAQTAYLVGRLEPQLREACRRGTIDPATCTQLREAGDTLKAQLFAPPQVDVADILFNFLSVLAGAHHGGGEKPP